MKVKPFLKWAGGKSKSLPVLLNKFPKNGKRFIEPFLGAGVVSLNVDYPQYIVNDVNEDLMFVWKHLSWYEIEFINTCQNLFVEKNNCREMFDELKKEFNETKDILRKSSLFVYLNRHCFNGLCRYNSKKQFNVPFGKYKTPYFPRKEMIQCLDKVKKLEILNVDFREMLHLIQDGDVIYCDPPYFPISETASFTSYSSGGFSLKDQIDLAEWACRAALLGATVVVSNHYNWYSSQLYAEMFHAKISTLEVSRTISSKTNERNAVKEVIAVFAR